MAPHGSVFTTMRRLVLVIALLTMSRVANATSYTCTAGAGQTIQLSGAFTNVDFGGLNSGSYACLIIFRGAVVSGTVTMLTGSSALTLVIQDSTLVGGVTFGSSLTASNITIVNSVIQGQFDFTNVIATNTNFTARGTTFATIGTINAVHFGYTSNIAIQLFDSVIVGDSVLQYAFAFQNCYGSQVVLQNVSATLVAMASGPWFFYFSDLQLDLLLINSSSITLLGSNSRFLLGSTMTRLTTMRFLHTTISAYNGMYVGGAVTNCNWYFESCNMTGFSLLVGGTTSASSVNWINTNNTIAATSDNLAYFNFAGYTIDFGVLIDNCIFIFGTPSAATQAIIYSGLDNSPARSYIITNSRINLTATVASAATAFYISSTNRNTMSFVGNTFFVNGVSTYVTALYVAVDTRCNSILISGNTFYVTGSSNPSALSLVTSFNNVGQLNVRSNRITVIGSAAYAFAINSQISAMTNVSLFAFDYNTVSVTAVSFAVGVYVAPFPSLAPLFSMRNNTMTLTASQANVVWFQSSLSATMLDISWNTFYLNAVPSVYVLNIGIVPSVTGLTIILTDNVMYGDSTNVSNVYAAQATVIARCNRFQGQLVTMQLNLIPVVGLPCGVCNVTADCGAKTTNALLYQNVSQPLDACPCYCRDGTATLGSMPKEDQCVIPTTTAAPATTLVPTTTTILPTSTTAAATIPTLIPTTTVVAPSTVPPTTATPNTSTPVPAAPTTTTTAPTVAPVVVNVSTPKPTSVPIVTTQVTQGATGIAVAGGGASASAPGWSAHASRNALLASLVQCPNPIDPNDALDPLENPIGLSIGNHITQQYLGAVVGDLAIVCALVALQLFVALITALVTEKTLWGALLFAKLPRANFMWWMLFLQPLIRCSLVLMSASSGSPGDFVVAALVLTLALGSVFLMGVNLVRASHCVDYVEEVFPPGHDEGFLEWFFGEGGRWEPRPNDPDAKLLHKLYKPLYAPFAPRGRFFVMADLIMAILFGILGAIIPETTAECVGQAAAMFACTVVYLLAALLARPFDMPFENIILGLLSFLEMLTAGLIMWFTTDQNERSWARDASQWTSTAAMWVVLAVVLKDCVSAVIRVTKKHCVKDHHGDEIGPPFTATAAEDAPYGGDDDGGEGITNPITAMVVSNAATDRVARAMAHPSEDWVMDAELALWHLVSLDVYYDGATGQYFDGQLGLWYNPTTASWHADT